MPFRPDPFLKKFERIRQLRQMPVLGYSVAVGSVAAAAIVREGFAAWLVGVRFAPYYIAVALTATLGSGGAGLLALLLSVIVANYLWLPDVAPATPTGTIATAMFLIIAGAMLTLIWLLNHALDRIWQLAEKTRIIVESQPAGVIGVDSEGRITLVNSAVERQLGYSREELFDQPVDQLVPIEVRHRHAQLRASYIDNPEPKMMGKGRDLSAVAKDGSLVPVEIGLNPVVAAGRVGALATIVDISERKDLELRAQILANEVSHRARNLLAVVQALASRKLPREGSADFISTLDTLARTQKIFGRKTVAPLHAIIEGEISAFREQTSISGCDVLLTPAAGQDFSLIIHELTTNALKYGAFSAPGGKVSISGHESETGSYHLTWVEAEGPPIDEAPKRVGFGQKVLQEIARGLHAEMSLDFRPEGLSYHLAVPLERITNVSELAGILDA